MLDAWSQVYLALPASSYVFVWMSGVLMLLTMAAGTTLELIVLQLAQAAYALYGSHTQASAVLHLMTHVCIDCRL